MADIKILPTQPKTIPALVRENTPMQTPFGVFHQEKINNLNHLKQTDQQNTTLLSEQNKPFLQGLLEDTQSAVKYIQSLLMIKEMIPLMNIGSDSSLLELKQLYQSLFIQPQHILEEINHQHQESTSLHGALFKMIKAKFLQANPTQQKELLNLLMNINGVKQEQNIIKSILSQLHQLKDRIGSPSIQTSLATLIETLTTKSPSSFNLQEFNTLFSKLESNLQLDYKTQNLVRMLQYNVSRIIKIMPTETLLQQLINVLQVDPKEASILLNDALLQEKNQNTTSKVIESLLKIMSHEILQQQELNSTENITKMIRNILSSPSHVLPLMHFILPVRFQEDEVHGELWVSQNESFDTPENSSFHILLSLLVRDEDVLEIEFKGQGLDVNIDIHGSEQNLQGLKSLEKTIKGYFKTSKYHLNALNITPQNSIRSIFQVFEEYQSHFIGINTHV